MMILHEFLNSKILAIEKCVKSLTIVNKRKNKALSTHENDRQMSKITDYVKEIHTEHD